MTRPTTILLIEDNSVWRATMCLLCSEIAPEVELLHADTFAKGLEIAKIGKPKACILDLILPDSTLQQTAENWRMLGIPTVFLSSVTKRKLEDGSDVLPKNYEHATQAIKLAVHAAQLAEHANA